MSTLDQNNDLGSDSTPLITFSSSSETRQEAIQEQLRLFSALDHTRKKIDDLDENRATCPMNPSIPIIGCVQCTNNQPGHISDIESYRKKLEQEVSNMVERMRELGDIIKTPKN